MLIFTITNARQVNEQMLCKKWCLDKYIIDYTKYEPEKKEQEDYICFDPDGNYTALSEGETEHGTWGLNINGSYIILKDETGQVYKVFIVSITAEVLILRYSIKEIRDVEVKYKSEE
jgi:hypothetical protein